MAESGMRRGALAHRGAVAAFRGGGVRLAERPLRPILLLRGAPEAGFLDAVSAILGGAPPTAPNTATETGTATLLWLGPDEWLVQIADEAAPDIPSALADALTGHHAALVDVRDGRTVIRVAGPGATALLAQGCSLDLHPRAFSGVAQTLLAKVDILLHRVTDDEGEPAFDVHVGRSYADYLWRWLTAAAG